MGLVESFVAAYFCRICEASKVECKTLTVEDSSQLRTIEKYNTIIQKIQNMEKVNYSETVGVKRYCELNSLEHFHSCQNFSVDIMHDLNEGIIPFLLKNVFTYILKLKIMTEAELKRKIQYYDYGKSDNSNIPSVIMLEKRNLNQNASQTKCLFKNIPFILHHLKDHPMLADVWVCVKSLLRITQIAYSSEISPADLDDLQNYVHEHLTSIRKCFPNSEFLAKHHFITHYSTIIRTMGPLTHMKMIRYEAKHKALKNFSKHTRNFINVNKTIAKQHQQMMARIKDSYRDKISHRKLLKLSVELLEKYKHILEKKFGSCEQIFHTNSLTINGVEFRKGFYVLDQECLFEIYHIFKADNEYFFLCSKSNIRHFDAYLNSIQLEPANEDDALLLKSTAKNRKTYEKTIHQNESYVILETLELKKLL